MRLILACVSVGALMCIGIAGCERAETPTPAETPAAQDSSAQSEDESRGGTALSVSMSGAEEVPGPGDPDGTGTAQITPDGSRGEVCFELSVESIQTANAAHIHKGAAGAAGEVAVALEAPAQGTSKGCVTADQSLVRDIEQNPASYYVNVHNAEFPQGAVRGQLQR